MKIRMLETRRLCEDGFSVKQYKKGEVYDVRDSTARMAIRNGWATEAYELVLVKNAGKSKHEV